MVPLRYSKYDIRNTVVNWNLNEYTGMKPGLERIKKFLESIKNPQERFKSILIAGTNGKGSTAVMLSNILQQSGYRTGLYTSPHLVRLNERILVDSKEITDKEFLSLASDNIKAAKVFGLTFFEFITAIAFIYFQRKKVDIAVLEAGLGGRYDAVNVIKNPLLSIITEVGYDHCQILGNTLEKIAFEKAGIIRNNVPLVTGVTDKKILKIFESKTKRILVFGSDFKVNRFITNWRNGFQQFVYHGFGKKLKQKLQVLGNMQPKNCSLALTAGILINGTDKTKKVDLLELKWLCRFELVKKGNITFILDGAHNPDAAKQFVATFKKSPYSKKKHALIFGILKDKDYKKVIKIVSECSKEVILVKVDSPRALETGPMKKEWMKNINKKYLFETGSLAEALEKAKQYDVAVVTGSLYLTGQVLGEISKQ